MAPGRATPRRERTRPAGDPRPAAFRAALFSAPPRIARCPFAAALPREDLGVLACPRPRPYPCPGLGSFPGGRREPWKRGIGEENGGWDTPTWSSRLGFLSLPFLAFSWPCSPPAPRRRCWVSSHSASPGEPPHPLFLQFPPTLSSMFLPPSPCGPRSHPRETSFGSPSRCQPFAYFHHVPFQPSSCLHPRVWLVCASSHPCILCSAAASVLVLQAVTTGLALL